MPAKISTPKPALSSTRLSAKLVVPELGSEAAVVVKTSKTSKILFTIILIVLALFTAAHEVVSKSSLSAQRLTTVQLGPKSVMELPTPAILTAEELDCLFELHEMAKKKCIVAFIYLHGMIKMGVPHVQAPEGVCVTMIRASPTGCQALGGTPEEVTLLEESIAAGLPSSLLFRKADAALRARETRHVSDFLYKIQEHLLFEIEYPPEKQSAINNYIRALHTRIEPEHHCSAVECVPDQLFFNKMYGTDHLKHHKLDAIRIIHMKSSVDLFSVMLKCGFGSLDAKRGLDIIYRDQVFSFFKAMGVTMLTIIDHSCSSVVLPDTHDDPSAAEIRDFLKTNKGVLGGNSCRKTHSPAV